MRKLPYLLFALPLMAQAPAGTATPEPAQQQQTSAAPAPQPAQPAAPPAEQWFTGSIDVGYRFLTDIRGDMNTYRSIVNLGEGPKLLNAAFTIQPVNHRFVDRIDVQASSWGGDPYNTLRIDARRQGLYDFTFDYRNIAYFNFLPSYANPGRINPAMPFLNENGFDIWRRTANAELDLFPGHRIVPYVAYSRNGDRGSGTTNFVLDSNEYPVPTNYNSHTNDARGGVRFEFKHWHATLEGGGLNYRDDQQVLPGSQLPNLGNLPTPILGQQLSFDGGTEAYGIRGGASFMRALFTADPVSWADVSAQFLYSQPHTDIHFNQNATGNLFDIATASFFNSELLDATGASKQPNPSANIGVTLKPFGGRLRIMESWMTDRMHTAGSLILLDQMLVTGTAPTPTALADSTRYVVNYNQQELDLMFDVTSFLTLRAGHRYVWGDTSAPPSLTIEGQGLTLENGVLRQNVALAGASFRVASRVRVNLDFEDSPGDRTYFRTSLNQYKRGRVMARWQARTDLQLTGRFSILDNQNPDPAIRYDFRSQESTLSANWTPASWKGFGVLGEYSRQTLRSDITYVIPDEPNAAGNGLATDLSHYRENANIGTLMADVPTLRGKYGPKLSFGGSFYRSAGTRPARFWQPQARFSIPLCAHAQFYTEWRWYALTQPLYLYEGFRSHQFTTALKFTM